MGRFHSRRRRRRRRSPLRPRPGHRAAAIDALGTSPGYYTGALVLDAPSWLECVLWGGFDIGDHTMVVGEVVASGVQQGRSLLIFLHDRYHTLENSHD